MASFFAHESAYVDTGAEIGDDTRIWHFTHVMRGARIGQRCSLGQNVFVSTGASIGDDVRIQNNVSVYEGVVLEDFTFCGPSAVFTNVKRPRSAFPRKEGDEYETTRVRIGASIGANAVVVCGTTIGEWAFVAAGAVVTRNVPSYGLVAGVPASLRGWICQCGTRLEFARDEALCTSCGRGYVRDGELSVALLRTE